MKESDARVDQGAHQMLLYVEKPDGTYGTLQTGSALTRDYLDDFREKQHYFHQTYLDRVAKGETSPIAYYLDTMELTPAEAAARLGLRVASVRTHLTPRGFRKLSVATLGKYAQLFGIPAARLLAMINPLDMSLAWEWQATSQPEVTILSVKPRQKPQ